MAGFGGKRWTRIAGWVAGVALLLLLLLALFPWGLVARHAAGPLSRAFGRPVTIADARREDWISFVPTIALDSVRVAQPRWAEPGDIASVRTLRMRLPIFPLLFGHVRPRAIEADGLTLRLVRDAGGRANWSGGRQSGGSHDGRPRLADLTIRDGRLRLEDAKRGMVLDATLSSDRVTGFHVEGRGVLHGAPLRLAFATPPIATANPAKPFPAHLTVDSALASIDATLRMDHPLDTNHFAARMTASGRDLGYLDDIIEAGLFRTQPFRLAGDLRHDGEDWHISRLEAMVGRSMLTATLDVTKPNGRTHLDGRIDAPALDFDDFASDAQKADAAAETARIGPRVVPGTRIVLAKLRLDGTLRLHATRLLSKGSSPFRSLDATATLDDRRLTVSPLAIGLPQGRATGTAAIDDRGRTPWLTLDLRIAGATIEGFFPAQQVVAGPMRARVRLAGRGDTVREALAHGDGKVAFVVDRGSVRRDYATFLGGDVFKSVGAAAEGKTERTGLDCLIASFAVSHGRMTPRPLLLSTPVARGDGEGTIMLGPETMDLRIVGRPTRPGLLLSTAPVRLFGTLSHPRIDIRPPRAKNQRENDIVSRVGFFIKKLRVRGDANAAAASPSNCTAEIGQALR